MPFSRSSEPYFHQPLTHKLIQEIADQESLVIYAGAGVSIDRTGMSWRELMSRLMEDYVQDPAVRQSLMEIFTPQQAASVVSQMYFGRFEAKSAVQMVNKLRVLLYSAEQGWQRGVLVTAIVNLAAAFHDRGKSVHLVTTNYDNFLDEEVSVLNAAREKSGKNAIDWQSIVVDYGAVADPGKLKAEMKRCVDVGKIVHLHGYVPEIGENGDSRIILSELDYFESQTLSTEILADLFSRHAVLVLGASLTDPPLLNALARTKIRQGVKPRVAVMPLQGIERPRVLSDTETSEERIVQEYITRSLARMKQFDLKGTFPDFYCQVPQLLTELQIAVERCSHVSYPQSTVRYGQRLTRWWGAWHGARNAEQVKCQSADHDLLRRALDKMSEALDAHNETMKLEMWLRWEPSTRRILTLWASSTGTWSDFKSMREADVGADSKYASVRAFCLGRPQIYPTEDDSQRWQTHLCVPVRTRGGDDFPVGVISLASFFRSDNYDSAPVSSDSSPVSKIGVWNGAQVATVVNMLATIGEAIVRPTPQSPNEIDTLLDGM